MMVQLWQFNFLQFSRSCLVPAIYVVLAKMKREKEDKETNQSASCYSAKATSHPNEAFLPPHLLQVLSTQCVLRSRLSGKQKQGSCSLHIIQDTRPTAGHEDK